MARFGEHPDLPDALEALLADETASTVFLKADCRPRVKAGHISELLLQEVGEEKWSRNEVESLSEDLSTIVEDHQHRSDCFVEIERVGCRITQIGDLRVTCAWPPFSEAWEITVVRPVARLSLSEYELDSELVSRISDHHRGIFVVGKPGSGKTTFAQAIADHLDENVGAMVKTMEAPRDLQVAERITQYAPLEGDLEKTAEVIFLVRPDFVIFDEVRRARDFEIFGDVRLAGVGLLGVTHANSGLEAIQRLVGKVELGLIAQVLDTVIHIEKGRVHQVLEIEMVVRAPSGMDSELSRPVIEIREFPTRRLTHEMFAFGSEIAVVPVSEDAEAASPVRQLAGVELARLASGFTGAHIHAAIFTSDNAADLYVDDKSVGGVVGSGGSSIRALEEEVGGVRLKVKGASEMPHGMRRRLEESSWQSDLSDTRSRGGRKWEDGGGRGHRESGGGQYSGKQGGRGGGRRGKGGRR
jgi:ATPase